MASPGKLIRSNPLHPRPKALSGRQGNNAPGQKADNLILALHRPRNQQPRAANGLAMAAEDGRPDICLSCLEQKCILNLFN